MLKNKIFWLGFVVAIVAVVVFGEIQKGTRRVEAMTTLNTEWPLLKNNESKAVAVARAGTIVRENGSWFSFFNSSADDGSDGSKRPKEAPGGFNGTWVNFQPANPQVGTTTTSVTTEWSIDMESLIQQCRRQGGGC